MKKIILYLPVLLLMVLLMSSCKKDATKIKHTASTKSVTIAKNNPYVLDLGTYGTEEGVEINKQASHYIISEITRSNRNVVYTYQPELNFTGTDQVILESKKGNIGDGRTYNDIEDITINITITP